MPKLKLNRIKIVLVEQGKTSRDLVGHLKKTDATVSRWCTNDVQPSLETLFEVAKFLDIDIRELIVSTKK